MAALQLERFVVYGISSRGSSTMKLTLECATLDEAIMFCVRKRLDGCGLEAVIVRQTRERKRTNRWVGKEVVFRTPGGRAWFE